MLSDDITGAMSTGLRMTGAVISGAVKGFLLGGLIALAGAALIVGGIAAVHVFATAGILSAIGAGLAGSLAGGTAMFASGGAFLAAKIGAVVLGATSIIPGIREWPELFKKTVAIPSRVTQYTDDVAHAAAPKLTQEMERPVFDNPVKEGAGMEAMKRGDSMQASVSRA